ncbi:Golgi transport complex subunit [Saccharomycopsis crataegensis]|uniref:Conserved oligomeric Golgi complex subunit 3 n=1 Tax=Saccharomycopsis crataegensis TaxID=43959 RepID=A0AAV5QHX2_9ASCO|nr:Golgi transport complex subunit [Saccharomycopsis crataegensis]
MPANRHRSRSIVQAIASSVPVVPNHVSLELPDQAESLQTTTTIRRSHSLLDIITTTAKASPPENLSSHHPLTTVEKDSLWHQYVQSFEYDVLIDDEAEASRFNMGVSKYLNFQNDLLLKHSHNQMLLQKIDDLLESIYALNVAYTSITKDTKDFQQQSDSLMTEQQELIQFHTVVRDYLSHFEHLNETNAFLNKPGINRIVRSARFLKVLGNLDRSLRFIGEHPDFKDAESYQMVLQSSLTKALTLVKNYINNSLNGLYSTISTQLGQLNVLTANVLLYTKFEMGSVEINRFMQILYEKQQRHSGDYEGLLSDIHNNYFNIRGKLLAGTLKNQLSAAEVGDRPLIQFLQDNVSFYIGLVNDEYELFYKFFNDYRLHKFQQEDNPDLNLSIADHTLNFSETLTPNTSSPSLVGSSTSLMAIGSGFTEPDYFHDPQFNFFEYLSFSGPEFFNWVDTVLLEPLHDLLRPRILKENDITVLCQLISLLQKYYENDDLEEPEFDDAAQDWRKFQIDFARAFNPILTDIQARLIFKVQVYIDDNITKYKPRLDDFKVPPANAASVDENPLDSAYSGWYPTLRTAVQLLSQIHQLVNSAIFDDLAHGAVHLCIASLREAYSFSLKVSGPKDAQLFLMRNLLALKRSVEGFDIAYAKLADVDFDFSGLKQLFNKVASGTTTVGGLVEAAKESVPKIVTNMYDAKIEIQVELRAVVHGFMETVVEEMAKPLNDATTNTSELHHVMDTFKSAISNELISVKNLLSLYISDPLVAGYLVDGIKELLCDKYEDFYNTTVSETIEKAQLNELMEVDALIGYLGDVTLEILGSGGREDKGININDDDKLSVDMVQDLSDIE